MSGQPMRLLIVDDDPRWLEARASFLRESYGYAVETATDAGQAWSLVEKAEQPYDLALVAEMLPAVAGAGAGPAGAELGGRIKSHQRRTEVIILTGDGDAGPARQGAAATVLTFHARPSGLDELASIVSRAVGGAQPATAGREKVILERWIEANRALFAGRSEQEVLRHVLSGVEAVGFDRIRLYLLSDDGSQLVGKVGVGMDVPFVGVAWSVADDDKMQILIRDAYPHIFKREEGELSPRELRLGKEDVKEWASVPVLLQDKVIGSLSADNKRSGRPITEQDLTLLALFASQVAAVIAGIENADKEKEKLKLLEKLTQVTREVVAQLGVASLDEQLTLIARRAAELLEAEACEVLLVEEGREGYLRLEASYGHREDGFHKGREFAIVSEPGGGLTGHIASEGRLFRAHGDELHKHFAVRGVEADHTRSGRCYSLLAAPLKKTDGQEPKLVGLLRADNKKGADGRMSPSLGFSEEDAWVLQIFAEAIVVALGTADRVDELRAQRHYLSRLVESSPNGVISVDDRGFVTDSNVQAQMILGYEKKELFRKPAREIYEDPHEPRRVNKLLCRSAEGKLSNYETFVLGKAGERIPIRLAAAWLYDAQDRRIGSIGYFEDLRPIKSTVKQLTGLLAATNIIAQAPNLADGLQRLAEKMAEDLKTSFCRIFLFDEGQQVLVAKAAHAILDDGDAPNWKPGLGEPTPVSEWKGLSDTLAEGSPVLLKITGTRSRPVLEEWSDRLGLGREIQSLLVLPLRTKERTLGLLDLGQLKGWEEAPFTEEKKELAAAIAEQAAVLIDRVRLHESTEHRMEQLVALNERLPHLRGDKEPPRLLQEVVRLTTELAHCRVGGLYINHPRLQELVLTVTYNLPEQLIGGTLPHAKGAAGRVARSGELEVFHKFRNWPEGEAVLEEFGLTTVVAIPLRQAGEVEAVLFVADDNYVEPDARILQRFVDQAAVALQTARLISPEQRTHSRSKIWRKISQYVSASEDINKVLHVILTAITAGYGLGFNRASIFLLDDRGEYLLGRMGVGQQSENEAKQAWEYDHRQALYDFGHYLDRLEKGDVPETPVNSVGRGLRLPVRDAGDDAFSRVVKGRERVLVAADSLDELPEAFRDAFGPTSPTVVIPLIARDQLIGILVADNKFTLSPITPELIESLCDFANTAAVAIDKDMLRERLFDLNRASGALVPSQDLERVLHDIAEQTRLAANASWVSMILIDEMAQVRKLVIEGSDRQFDTTNLIRPGGISMEVMRGGTPYVIEDASAPKQSGRVNPSMFRDGSVAALCLPLLLPGKKMGVMWIHYDKPRAFPQFEVDALQLYVNHAAITYDSARRLEELEQMRRAAEALAGAADPQEVLKRIVQRARRVLQTDSAVILSYDPTGQTVLLESSAAEGIPADVWEQFRSEVPRRSQTAHAVMELGWVGVEDLGDERQCDFLGNTTRTLLDRVGARSFQATTLTAGEEKLGVLYMIYNRPRRLSGEERRTAETFANHVALALRQARLSSERDKRLREQEALVMLSKELLQRQSLQDALNAAVKVAKEALGADLANIVLEEQSGELVFAAQLGWEGVEVGKTRVTSEDSMTGFTLMEKQPVRVDDYNRERRFPVLDLVRANRLASGMSVPMLSGDEVVGTMAVHTRTPHRFSDAEQNLLSLIANQTAIAIKSALQEKERTRLRALNEASKAISRSSSGFERGRVLKQIVEEAVNCIADRRGRKSYLGIIQLYKPSTNELFFESASLPDELNSVMERIGSPRVLDPSLGKIGITGRAALIRQPQLVPDVAVDPDYLMISDRIRSAVAVPLLSGDEVAGVIDLESERPDAFDEDDLETLQALAELAVIAVQNAKQFEELKQTKVEVGWSTALAWMGMASSSWLHTVNSKTVTIKDTSSLLSEDLEGELTPEGLARVKVHVARIERVAGEILKEKSLPPLSTPEAVSSVPVNQTVHDRVMRLWQREPYNSAELKPFDFALPDSAKVGANSDWLHRALDVLVENAVGAVADCTRKEIGFATREADGNAEILVSDSGRGIPREVLDKLLKEQIKRSPPESGRGVGLLIAQAIIRSYKGDLRVGRTSPEGTMMIIALPLET